MKSEAILMVICSCLSLALGMMQICYYHNTTTERAYIQCGNLKAAEHLNKTQEHLDIENIQIGYNTSLPTLTFGLFTPFKFLKALILNNANIERVDQKAFLWLDNLEEISLFNNKITNLEPGVFNQLGIVRLINLGGNKIEYLQDRIFSNLYQLDELVLRWNIIRNISRETFEGLRYLRKLDLEGNRISTLPSDVFADLFFLENLDLSFNALKELPPNLFANQRDLLMVNFATNDIEHLPDVLLQNTTALQFIDVSDNLLSRLNETSFATTSVDILRFSRNNIRKINATKLLLHDQWLNEVDIDYNPWECTSLRQAVDEFQKSQVYFQHGTKFQSEHNVFGIECDKF